ncbi:hypothetical protein BC831DRAFT_515257 [Entophlyctis helioformis]|nr:hypothetical protein BC831DRAFT_515257 [Entophlyctis helioformis]
MDLAAFHASHWSSEQQQAFARWMLPSAAHASSGPAAPQQQQQQPQQAEWTDYCLACQAAITDHYEQLGWTAPPAAAGSAGTKRGHSSDTDRHSEHSDHTEDQQEDHDDDGHVQVDLTPEVIAMFRFSAAYRTERAAEREEERRADAQRDEQERLRTKQAADDAQRSKRQRYLAGSHGTHGTLSQQPDPHGQPHGQQPDGQQQQEARDVHAFTIATLQFGLDRGFDDSVAQHKPVLWPVLPIAF